MSKEEASLLLPEVLVYMAPLSTHPKKQADKRRKETEWVSQCDAATGQWGCKSNDTCPPSDSAGMIVKSVTSSRLTWRVHASPDTVGGASRIKEWILQQ